LTVDIMRNNCLLLTPL